MGLGGGGLLQPGQSRGSALLTGDLRLGDPAQAEPFAPIELPELGAALGFAAAVAPSRGGRDAQQPQSPREEMHPRPLRPAPGPAARRTSPRSRRRCRRRCPRLGLGWARSHDAALSSTSPAHPCSRRPGARLAGRGGAGAARPEPMPRGGAGRGGR